MKSRSKIALAAIALIGMVCIILALPFLLSEKIQIVASRGMTDSNESMGFIITGHLPFRYATVPVEWRIVNLDCEVSYGMSYAITDFSGNFEPIYTPRFSSYTKGTSVRIEISINFSGIIIQQAFNETF